MSMNSYNAPIVTFVLSEIKCGQINSSFIEEIHILKKCKTNQITFSTKYGDKNVYFIAKKMTLF